MGCTLVGCYLCLCRAVSQQMNDLLQFRHIRFRQCACGCQTQCIHFFKLNFANGLLFVLWYTNSCSVPCSYVQTRSLSESRERKVELHYTLL
jgi:hypothetical protein